MEGLTLSRYQGQQIVVTHRDLSAPVVLTVLWVAQGRARINIKAPDDVVLMRGELLDPPAVLLSGSTTMMLNAIPLETAGEGSPPLVRLFFDLAPKDTRGPCTLCLEIHAGRMDIPGRDLVVEILGQMARQPDFVGPLLERLNALDDVLAFAMSFAHVCAADGNPTPLARAAKLATNLAAAGWRIELGLVDVDGQPMHGDPITGTSYVEGID